MASKADLVAEVKNIQRSDPSAKQGWWDYCDQQLGGVKDPNRHDASVLSGFLSAYSSGSLGAGYAAPACPAPAPSRGGGRGGCGGAMYAQQAAMFAPPAQWGYAAPAAPQVWGGGGGGGGSLAEFIKTGQRQSQNWKKAWQSYCALNGNGKFDPAKYDDGFIIGFIEHVGNLAAEEFATQAQAAGVDLDAMQSRGMKRPSPSSTAGPPKRPTYTGSGGSTDVEKADLVAKVKDLQRSNPDAKQAWWTHCDEQLGGVRDPNRHDTETLQTFMFSWGG